MRDVSPSSFMPQRAPLAMPRQELWRSPHAPRLAQAGFRGRRAAMGAATVLTGTTVAAVLFSAFGGLAASPVEWATTLLSTALSAWVGFGFASAVAGLAPTDASPARPIAGAPRGRTAILLPVYDEDPGLVLSAVEAVADDLRRVGAAGRFDLFVLSDTRDEAIACAEAAGVTRLRARLDCGAAVYYRRRPINIDRKAGNIAEWVRGWGATYAFMLVLDADSLMAGETIVELAEQMEANPSLGLLQTVPAIVNAQTPFARVQQFAARLYGPLFARGQQWWSASEGNYWGHNAIIRVAAFAQSAGLPHLPGPTPWGGHILSHDFIEAALLRRNGWAVRAAAGLGGSFEETPPTILDTAARDRRWCQGNLQHARLIGARGLHPLSRLHLGLGIGAYLAPVLWFALLVCGAVAWPQEARRHDADHSLATVFVFMLALLIAPKIAAVGLALASPEKCRGFGGAVRLLAGFVIECAASLLITPVTMVMQAAAVAEVLIGRDSGWKTQRREGVELSRREAWQAHRGHVLLGVGGAAGALALDRAFLIWASPVFLSLALSALLSLHTSRPGRADRPRAPLLATPEDIAPPPVLARAQALRAAYAAEAAMRRQIEALMREPAALYEIRPERRLTRAPLAA